MNLESVYKELLNCKSYTDILAIADRLSRNSQNQLASREEAYLLMISLLLRRITK